MSGLTDPTSFAFLPDGRIIVTQKDGRLFLVVEGRPLTSAILTLQPSEENERGVSGVTVDPDFAQNGYIYVYYTTSVQSCLGPTCDQASRAAAQSEPYPGPKNRVSRFTLAGDAVDPDSETVILDGIPSDSGYHNAGCMAFGPDGYLYLTTGDGGETAAHAQDLNSLSGKVLRIAADGSVPADNPYVGVPGARGEVWSLGFRNPWKFTFDERGRLLVGDVGENALGGSEHRHARRQLRMAVVRGPGAHRQRARGARRRRRCRAARVEQHARERQLEATAAPVARRRDAFLPSGVHIPA